MPLIGTVLVQSQAHLAALLFLIFQHLSVELLHGWLTFLQRDRSCMIKRSQFQGRGELRVRMRAYHRYWP